MAEGVNNGIPRSGLARSGAKNLKGQQNSLDTGLSNIFPACRALLCDAYCRLWVLLSFGSRT